MESALYDAEDGFYARGAVLGARGTFTTAPIAAPFHQAVRWPPSCGAMGAPRPTSLVHVARSAHGDGSRRRSVHRGLSAARLVLCDRAGHADGALPGARTVEARAARRPRRDRRQQVHDACPATGCAGRSNCWSTWRRRALRVRPAPAGALRHCAPRGDRRGRAVRVSQQAECSGRGGTRAAADRPRLRRAGHYERPPAPRTYVGGLAGGGPISCPGTQDITVDADFGAAHAGRGEGCAAARHPAAGGCSGTCGGAIAPASRHDADRCGSRRCRTLGSGAASRARQGATERRERRLRLNGGMNDLEQRVVDAIAECRDGRRARLASSDSTRPRATGIRHATRRRFRRSRRPASAAGAAVDVWERSPRTCWIARSRFRST
jgi:hypothetical protein